jgi:hypothetical protein
MFQGEPAEDEAGFGVRMGSEDDAVGVFVHGGGGCGVSASGLRTARALARGWDRVPWAGWGLARGESQRGL